MGSVWHESYLANTSAVGTYVTETLQRGRGQEETHLAVLETGLQKIFLPTWSAKILFLTSPCEDKRALMLMMQIENEEITGER